MYIIKSFASILPSIHIPIETAGLMWHPDMSPITYAIATIDNPNAIAIPRFPKTEPAIAALPHPNNTRTIVPINSAIYLFISEIIPLKTVGLIIIFITFLQYIAPAQNVVKAFREKNDKLIPITSTICGSLCSGGWTLFGLIIGDINCIIPNGLGLISSIMTALVWLYIKGTKKKEDKDEEELAETLNDEEK